LTGATALLLGVGLGLRHAADADHVVVLSTLLQKEPGLGRAARLAALWGAGHTAAFLGVGLLVVLAGVRVPPHLERAAELAVAAMLIGLGVWHLARGARDPGAASDRGTLARPVAAGVLHGLAGSAGVALIAATTIGSRLWAAAYLTVFGLGTVAGMVLLTVLLAWPIGWTLRRRGSARAWMIGASSALSVLLGAALGVEALGGV
jgi:nickel/cobalt transporter (NicO) family protein